MAGPHLRDGTDVAQDMTRDPADIAVEISSLKGEAMNWLDDPRYGALRLRLEYAHAAVEAVMVEARRRGRLNEGS